MPGSDDELFHIRVVRARLVPEQVTYDVEIGLIRVRAWGVDTIDDWNSSKEQVLQLHATHGANKLLVDVREQESAPSTLEIFDFGSDWPVHIRTAIVSGDRTRDEQFFLETVAFNRAKQMRLFEKEDEALEWLASA